ncbi:MAG: hypothetical protein JWO89_1680, partial [Verrucomicrobiaceae bacterium]|nr:hypothetical protein [Verrucomicrobiaceae bacterium]
MISSRKFSVGAFLLGLMASSLQAQLDQNTNQQSDIWEMYYSVQGLVPGADTDHDGFTNAMESIGGTNPLDPLSYPRTELSP